MEVAKEIHSDHARPHLSEDGGPLCTDASTGAAVAKRFRYFKVVEHRGGIPELDGLRAIAILLVLARHGVRPFYDAQHGLLPLGAWDLATPLLNGWAGVDLFFVLSGFLITHHLLRRWPTTFNRGFLYRYGLKRACRIVPAYYAMLGIAAFGLIPYYAPHTSNLAEAIPIHLAFMQDYLKSNIVVVFWSLGVEEKFYLLAPFVLLLVRRMPNLRFKCFALILLAILPLSLRLLSYYSDPLIFNYEVFFWRLRAPFHLILDGFWMGAICALLYENHPAQLPRDTHLATYVLWIGCTIIFLLLFPKPLLVPKDWIYSIIVLFLFPLGFASILFAIIFQPSLAPFLKNNILAYISKLSYCLYLVHITLIPLTIKLLNHMVSLDHYSPFLQFLLFVPPYLLLSLLGALVLHFAVEKPFLLIKDRIRM